ESGWRGASVGQEGFAILVRLAGRTGRRRSRRGRCERCNKQGREGDQDESAHLGLLQLWVGGASLPASAGAQWSGASSPGAQGQTGAGRTQAARLKRWRISTSDERSTRAKIGMSRRPPFNRVTD